MITLVLAIITIPLENNLNSWAIVSFCIAGVIQQPLKHLFSRLRTDHYWKRLESDHATNAGEQR